MQGLVLHGYCGNMAKEGPGFKPEARQAGPVEAQARPGPTAGLSGPRAWASKFSGSSPGLSITYKDELASGSETEICSLEAPHTPSDTENALRVWYCVRTWLEPVGRTSGPQFGTPKKGTHGLKCLKTSLHTGAVVVSLRDFQTLWLRPGPKPGLRAWLGLERAWAWAWAWELSSPGPLKPGPSPGFQAKPGPEHHYLRLQPGLTLPARFLLLPPEHLKMLLFFSLYFPRPTWTPADGAKRSTFGVVHGDPTIPLLQNPKINLGIK
ncbi:hypothetical protein C8F04DRAFT_1182032 [Mycena alexandri]|uniref:Uncharacterized protein n=1 Tax=Mycena alexandri TaxID=1745969 RepID=A0AAD6SZM5_9AGAR|nr:hypothetical protein C8F04DRAFT_1182032 [Mycena alexandri]